jgi:hypothetical protein
VPDPRSFNTYIYSLIRAPGTDLGTRIVESLVWCRDHLNGGSWGQMADATLVSGERDFHGMPRGNPGPGAGPVGDLSRPSFDDGQLARLAEHINRGEVRTLTVDLDYLDFAYTRYSPDYHRAQLIFYDLFAEDGTSSFVERFRAVFDPASPLVNRRLTALSAWYGFVEVVPTDAKPSSKALTTLVTWPPAGHYQDFLSRALVEAVGGAAELRAALPNHVISMDADGAALVRIPVLPTDARAEPAEAARDELTRFLAARLPADLRAV